MFEQIKWLFFDVGSTLIDEQEAYAHRLRDLAAASGADFEHVYETALLFYKNNLKGDKETAKLLCVELSQWHSEDERLYADAAQCLETLHSRYKIGIIANQNAGTAKRLEQHGILQHIDLVVASAEEGVAKPDRRIFEIALQRSGCLPVQAMMIGDRIDNDIVPAKKLGMHTVWIRQGFGKDWNIAKEEERPDCMIDSLSELVNRI